MFSYKYFDSITLAKNVRNSKKIWEQINEQSEIFIMGLKENWNLYEVTWFSPYSFPPVIYEINYLPTQPLYV